MRLRDLPLWLVLPAAQAAAPTWRWQAPVAVQRPGSFVELPLSAATYAHSEQPDLGDLRLLDAAGQRVPFAFLPPAPRPLPAAAPAALYPLPRQRRADGDWVSPLTLQLHGGELRVQPRAAQAVPADTPGWLVDLGPARTDAPRPTALQLAWDGGATFTAPYELETSDDLRHWQPAGSGQLMALQSNTGPLTQAQVPLPDGVPRFVRLLWQEPATAPRLRSAQPQFAAQDGPASYPPIALTFKPVPTLADASPGALCVDLGGPLPVSAIDVDPGPAPQVLPLRIEGRAAAGQPWQPVARGVSYRLQRDNGPVASPPLQAQVALRHLCVVPDARAAAPSPARLRLTLQVHLPRLVFAAQGQPPYTLQTGAPDAPPGALPAATLVPALATERARLGQATLGDWAEDAAVARARDSARQRATWRRWLLWGVLLAGVAGLGGMVWRLARKPITS
jgi:hypothetical protein